jgi:sodium/proline symporter
MVFTEQTIVFIVVLTAYMFLIMAWGFYQGKKVKTGSDFSIAGRKLPGWVASLSERATGESSWALLGLPGAAYATGLMEIWTAAGCVLGVIVAWIFLAGRIRDEAEKYEVDTFTDYIARRHGEVGTWIRIVSSLAIVFFFFFYVGAQFIGGGKTLENLLGLDEFYGMIFIFILVVPYTIYGGFRSVTYTDVIQAILMVIAVIVGPIFGILYLAKQPEGTVFAHSMTDALAKAGESYSSMTGGIALNSDSALYQFLTGIFPNAQNLVVGVGAGIIIAASFSWFFGYMGGQPQLTTRFMAISNKKQAIHGRNIGIVWTVIAYTGAIMMGFIGLAIFGPGGLPDQEKVMPAVLTTVFPPVVAGILISGILAAIISTANSLLILSATELSENIVKPLRSKMLTNVQSLVQSRYVTAILSVIALVLAYLSPSKLIFTIVSFVWAGIGGTFSIVILFTLFWKRFHGRAALITIIFGLGFTIFWVLSGLEKVVPSRLLTFPFAGIMAVLATFLVSCKAKN